LAHEINNLPYEDDAAHLDIIEIDAASNRRIDEISELREKVYIAPTSAKYKVYIIDEVHMLTREAFNALLKTLEEPPAHVVFILATTEAHKLPETIISRTQHFSFKPVEIEKAVEHLRYIAKQEKIDITDEALLLIAQHGEGSFRDSIGLLDQASNGAGKIDLQSVQSLLGIPPLQSVEKLIDELTSPETNIQSIFTTLEDLYSSGYQAGNIAKQISKLLRDRLVAQTLPLSYEQTIKLLGRLIEVPASHNPERFLEIILLEAGSEPKPATINPPLPNVPGNNNKSPSPKKTVIKPAAQNEPEEPKATKPTPTRSKETKTPLNDTAWPQILAALKQKHNTLYSFVRMAQPKFSNNGALELAFGFAFHHKRVRDSKNLKILSDVIEEVTGQKVEVVCRHDPNIPTKPAIAEAQNSSSATDTTTPNESLSTISNIFGGAELLESDQ
jgi:DNA polymerase-3 subunit gamma/tau